jgi:hypothetical protein
MCNEEDRKIEPFDRIDAAQEYVGLLNETVADNKRRIETAIIGATSPDCQRTLDVLRVILYNLERLEEHLKASRQTLGNLHRLRRLLFKENIPTAAAVHETAVMESYLAAGV